MAKYEIEGYMQRQQHCVEANGRKAENPKTDALSTKLVGSSYEYGWWLVEGVGN